MKQVSGFLLDVVPALFPRHMSQTNSTENPVYFHVISGICAQEVCERFSKVCKYSNLEKMSEIQSEEKPVLHNRGECAWEDSAN